MMGNDVGYLSEGVGGAHHGRMAQRGIGYLMRKKRAELICRIDVTAFAAVMVVLLGILVYFPYRYTGHSNFPSVDLARVRHAVMMDTANRDDALIVTVKRDGTIYFRQGKTVPKILPVLIQDKIKAGSEHTVYINADARTKYGNVKEVLESVRAAGIERIVFLVESRREN